ncbi:DUF1922 domain-containing protein [Candidatus Bathyarchaeota archaeon]|nr:MAG: DUF1922 domain-containing protein [Candidatus Bathyarchaeota archaeon]HDD69723.1 DUF1922 domain-containing protein [Candidatus Bathyarchaeota archaeon]
MTSFLIVVCSRCGKFLLAKAGQKTRTCPYCGSRIILDRCKRVATFEDVGAASAILKKLKREAGERRRS